MTIWRMSNTRYLMAKLSVQKEIMWQKLKIYNMHTVMSSFFYPSEDLAVGSTSKEISQFKTSQYILHYHFVRSIFNVSDSS